MPEHHGEERRERSRESWAVILGTIFAIALAATGAMKTWFLNDYRIEQLEKDHHRIEEKIDELGTKLSRLEATYELLLQQAAQRGWKVPENWAPRVEGKP